MRWVIKIGGSLLFQRGRFHTRRFREYAAIIRQLLEQGHEFVLVVGGGVLAKKLVDQGVALGADRAAQDRLGIAATWVTAQLMITAIGIRAHSTPIMSEDQLIEVMAGGRLPVVGGLVPGQSTNAVAARVAEITHAPVVVNVTDVDGVYDKDPKRFSSARLLPHVTVTQLSQIISQLSSSPGTYPLFDRRALEIVKRARIEVWFVNGQKPRNLLYALTRQAVGTRVVPG